MLTKSQRTSQAIVASARYGSMENPFSVFGRLGEKEIVPVLRPFQSLSVHGARREGSSYILVSRAIKGEKQKFWKM